MVYRKNKRQSVKGVVGMEKCGICGHNVVEDSRRYQKRLQAFREKIGDTEKIACDDCMARYRNEELKKILNQRVMPVFLADEVYK